MQPLREAWGSLLVWMPSALRVSLALIVVLMVVTKLLPRLVHGLGALLRSASPPALALLTYPEYLTTTACRQWGWRLPPGTYTYGRGLGALAEAGRSTGTWMQGQLKKGLRFPWRTTIAVVAVLVGCWYLAPNLPDGKPKASIVDVNDEVVRVDYWLATGRWAAAANSTLPCSAKAAATTHVQRPRPSSKAPRKTKP